MYDEGARKLVLWQPSEGRRGSRLTFINTLLEDFGMERTQKLKTFMAEWRKCLIAMGCPVE